MIKITKEEKDFLVSRGARWGSLIHGTYSKYRHYYMTESPSWLKTLEKYRESKLK